MIDLVDVARRLSPDDRRALLRGESVIVPEFLHKEDEDILVHTLRFVCATLPNAYMAASVQHTLGVIAEAAPQGCEVKRAMTALRAILDYDMTVPRPDVVSTLSRLKAVKAPLVDQSDFISAMKCDGEPGTEKMHHWLYKVMKVSEKREK
ncbi:hypothetical protein [Acetobacter persici]|uniref:hypothetical protein n=1 Tax=Acetobacter persici TaxID=1076596 RepID=UPI001BAD1241|nr:hypothetical protein [Acetobacter persici]MBS1017045.1 hypothetical protein [Acetobacter persici]